MKDLEMRTLGSQPCELRSSGDGETQRPQIAGYAAVFNTRSALLFGTFVEEIAAGAFDDVMGDDVRALFNHDPNFVLGRTRSNTLRLEIDSWGLAYTLDPPDTQTVRDLVLKPLQRGDVTGSRFGFRVAPDGDEWRREGNHRSNDPPLAELRRRRSRTRHMATATPPSARWIAGRSWPKARRNWPPRL